ncbi:hypothetical protein L208DRAFT_1409431 [Tricholoma matsutake]|nr:hypothetical protein L208DRAFT_1409431 [Tricholoma matsutake 945]
MDGQSNDYSMDDSPTFHCFCEADMPQRGRDRREERQGRRDLKPQGSRREVRREFKPQGSRREDRRRRSLSTGSSVEHARVDQR